MPFKLPPSFGIGPTYNPVTEEWQKQKCHQLGISFGETFEQQPTLTGTLLSKIIPWQTEKISMDGNCFFRCISKILSGTQDHHMKLRGEVSRYMVTNGRSIIKRYLKTFSMDASPVTYLKKSGMTESGVWGTDIEIVAISCILDSDVYIATEQYDAKKLWTRTIWNRYSGCIDNPHKPPQVALYISNRNHDHYEPVTRLMNSEYDSVMN